MKSLFVDTCLPLAYLAPLHSLDLLSFSLYAVMHISASA